MPNAFTPRELALHILDKDQCQMVFRYDKEIKKPRDMHMKNTAKLASTPALYDTKLNKVLVKES